MSAPETTSQQESDVCLQCGLCCDGTLFAMVALTDQDEVAPLIQAGFALRHQIDGPHLMPQPCRQLDDLKCGNYKQRPCRCRHFECSTLKAFQTGELRQEEALQIIQAARILANDLKTLLSKNFPALKSVPIANLGRELKAYSRRLPLNERRRIQAEEKAVKKAYLKLRETLDAHFYLPDADRSTD